MSMSAKSSADDIGSQGSSDPYFDAFGRDSGLDTIKVSFMCITVPILMKVEIPREDERTFRVWTASRGCHRKEPR